MEPKLHRRFAISCLAIPICPKTRSQKFRAWLETWLPISFGPRTSEYEFLNNRVWQYPYNTPSCLMESEPTAVGLTRHCVRCGVEFEVAANNRASFENSECCHPCGIAIRLVAFPPELHHLYGGDA